MTDLSKPGEKRPRQDHAPESFQEILRAEIEAYVAPERIPPMVVACITAAIRWVSPSGMT